LKKYSLLEKIRFKFDHFNSFALSGLHLIFTRNEHLLRTTFTTVFSIGTQAQNSAIEKQIATSSCYGVESSGLERFSSNPELGNREFKTAENNLKLSSNVIRKPEW
jgi:hypothetical protein